MVNSKVQEQSYWGTPQNKGISFEKRFIICIG